MPKVIPSSISRGCVDVRTVTLKYPPSYFNVGAAGFRNVLTVVDEVAQAASPSDRPNRTKLPARKPLCGELVRSGKKILPTARQRAAPYSVMGRSQGIRPYSNHGDVLDTGNGPSPSKETATHIGHCDKITPMNESAKRRHQSSATHGRNLDHEGLLRPLSFELCFACPKGLVFKDSDAGQHIDHCTPKRRYPAAVRATQEERDRLEHRLGFETPRKVSTTNTFTPFTTPFATAPSPSGGTRSSISPSSSSTKSTPPPSTPSPPMSRASSPAHCTPDGKTDPSSPFQAFTGSFPTHAAHQFEYGPLADIPPRLNRLISVRTSESAWLDGNFHDET
ncbi:hypothetical protein BGW80DRAFT_277720 [Lactifluus volemus]|nr:hypothetical protein BGW80DRAFT_277720 [Lactifluus volemus]